MSIVDIIESLLFLLIGGGITITGYLNNADQYIFIIGILILLLGVSETLITIQEYRLKKHQKNK